MTDFTVLKPHLQDEQRREMLLKIEQGLREHPFPPQLVIENTSHCNLKCIHCSHKEMTRPQKHMERALWDQIVKEVAKEMPDCEVWPTFYGEALLLKEELWDRLHYADQVGCTNLVLNSNGTLLNRWDHIEHILNSPLKRFILSLDGFTKETFEKIRAKARWDDVYPALEELCRKRQERGQTYPSITAQFSVMSDNVMEAEAFSKHWRSFGAEVKIRPMLEWGTMGSIRTDTIIHDDEDFRIACPWAINTMAIHQDGRAVACAVDYDANFDVGLVQDMTVKGAWKALGEQVRTHHMNHDWSLMPNICQQCGDWQVAGASYEEETTEGTRPFWFYETQEKG
ncbi:radical SAM/SPASM domain-containing protein [Magnetococcales bacterium HHB-1]